MQKESISIHVYPIGILRKFVENQHVTFRKGTTPAEVIKKLGITDKLKIVPFINGKKADLKAELCDGDELKLVTLVTGG